MITPRLLELIEIFEGNNLLCGDVVKYIYDFIEYKFTNDNIRQAVRVYYGYNKEKALVTYEHISYWNVSKVTDMSELFKKCKGITDEDLSNWDTSNVTDMSYMFDGAVGFNGNISNWNVRNVTNMGSMFAKAFKFNGDIGNWNVSNVRNMSLMFHGVRCF